MQPSVHQEENGEADKLRRFRICGDASKQAGMSSGALLKINKTVYINAEKHSVLSFYFRKYPLRDGWLSRKSRLSDTVNAIESKFTTLART